MNWLVLACVCLMVPTGVPRLLLSSSWLPPPPPPPRLLTSFSWIRKEREAKAPIDLRKYKVFYIPIGWAQDLGDLSPILTLPLTSYAALGKLPALFS